MFSRRTRACSRMPVILDLDTGAGEVSLQPLDDLRDVCAGILFDLDDPVEDPGEARMQGTHAEALRLTGCRAQPLWHPLPQTGEAA